MKQRLIMNNISNKKGLFILFTFICFLCLHNEARAKGNVICMKDKVRKEIKIDLIGMEATVIGLE